MNAFQRLWAARYGVVGLVLAAIFGATVWGGIVYRWHASDLYKDLSFLHAARVNVERGAK